MVNNMLEFKVVCPLVISCIISLLGLAMIRIGYKSSSKNKEGCHPVVDCAWKTITRRKDNGQELLLHHFSRNLQGVI